MTFTERYENAPYVVRLRAPILRIVSFLFIGMMPLLVINALLNKQYSTIFITGIMSSVMAYSLIMLYRGNYNRSAAISVGTFAVSILVSAQMLGYVGEHTFVLNVVYAVLLSAYALVFSPTFRSVLFYSGIGIFSYILLVVRAFIGGSVTELSVRVNQQTIIPTTMLLMIVTILILARRILDKVTGDAIATIAESRAQAENLSILASEASEKLALAQSMEDQASETASSAEEIEKNTGSIIENISQLMSQYDGSLAALNTIASKMSDLDMVAADQSANITETSAAMEEMVASIKNVSEVIENKMTSVNHLRGAASDGSERIALTISAFKRVTEHLDSVKQMISIISGIASRTNLLAMNAAIEAAHAGDAGRGFAVVADEVRKLAESSAVNARQVGDTIQDLMSAINESGDAISASGESFGTIGDEVDQVGQAMDGVNLSIRELASGSDEILRATASLNELTVNVTTVVQEAREQESAVHVNVENMGSFINSLKQNMSEINGGTGLIRDVSADLRNKCNTINTFVQVFSEKLSEGSV